MIRVNKSEQFPILVSLFDEETNALSSGKTVYYDVRYIDDTPLSPPVSGTLTESSVQPGLYKKVLSLDEPGLYVCYATCSGFITSTEEITINEQNIYDLVNHAHHYNISVEEVTRVAVVPDASQIVRNVPLNKTDYIITRIKADDATDWSSPVASGTVYAWYRATTELVPYKMGGPN